MSLFPAVVVLVVLSLFFSVYLLVSFFRFVVCCLFVWFGVALPLFAQGFCRCFGPGGS